MRCNNCGVNISDDFKYCSHCGCTIKGFTIEDYLNDHFRIYAVIGVFGAIALYLGSFGSQNEQGIILDIASNLSLFIVVLLSLKLFFKINFYIKNCITEKENINNETYRTSFNYYLNIILLNLFGFISLLLFGLVAIFLFYSSIIGGSLQFIFYVSLLLLLMMVGVYNPAVNLIKTGKNKLAPFMFITFIISSLMIIMLYYLYDSIRVFNLYNIFIFILFIFISALTIYNCYCEYKCT